MPKGHYKRNKKGYKGFPALEIQHDLFNIQVVFQNKGHNPKVWKFLKGLIKREFNDIQEITESYLLKMNDTELDMLDY